MVCTAILPKAESIPAERMAHFLAQTQPLVAQLEQVTTLASNEPTASNL
jgi:hypothetical protein